VISLLGRIGVPEVNDEVTRPALRYFGGKWRLASWIIGRMPAHQCYVEPFGGGASVLLRKTRSRVEVLNDANGDVVQFFRVVRDRGQELAEQLALTPFALDEYSTSRDPAEDDLERARRYFVKSWGGHSSIAGDRARGWRRTPDRCVAMDFATAAEQLVNVCRRLQGVAIDNIDWREVLDRYDRPDTLFYLDPPYWRKARLNHAPSNGYGDYEITEEDHAELCELAGACGGAAMISGYDNPVYADALAGWYRHERPVREGSERSAEMLWVKARK
jgi:DNA adenine methylase